MKMCDYWPLLQTDVMECPFQFTEAELKEHSEEPTWFDLTALVNHWRDELGGMNEEGWVRPEMYDQALEKNRALRAKFCSEAEPDEVEQVTKGWPFQDKEEFS